jgi:hypothetical protein
MEHILTTKQHKIKAIGRILSWRDHIYIYSLYIKSPGLPIIKEAQASQHGHFG